MLTEKGAALTLGETAPHAELDAVVERIGPAFELDRAVPADRRSLALGCAPHEQIIRVPSPTPCLGHPGQTIFSAGNCSCRHPPPLLVVLCMAPKSRLNALLRPRLQQTVMCVTFCTQSRDLCIGPQPLRLKKVGQPCKLIRSEGCATPPSAGISGPLSWDDASRPRRRRGRLSRERGTTMFVRIARILSG